MKSGVTAAAWAEQRVTAVRDDPAGRLALMQRCYYGPFGRAPRHLPYRRAALSFMHWQLQRGVLAPPFSDRPGSPWWRAVNERIPGLLDCVRDGAMTYAWPWEDRGVWHPPKSLILQLTQRALPPARRGRGERLTTPA
ncbi:MAG TPA: hypothetical protein VLL69_20070 [Streptosporangiaceae bacterium]|nr:hypothetical protein [Streptosporangiaceae bacterium]